MADRRVNCWLRENHSQMPLAAISLFGSSRPEGHLFVLTAVAALVIRSNVSVILRSTLPYLLPLRSTGSQAGNIVVHQKRIDNERRCGAEERPRHDLPPGIHVASDEGRNDSDRQYELIGRSGKCQRVYEIRPGDGKGEDHCRDNSRDRHGDENAKQHLDVTSTVNQRGLVQLLRDARKIADHQPGRERNRQRGVKDNQHPPMIDKLDSGGVVDKRKGLEEWDEQQLRRNEVS